MNFKNQTRKSKNLIIQCQNHENHEVLRIPCHNNKNDYNLIITRRNYKKNEMFINPCHNLENHKNLKIYPNLHVVNSCKTPRKTAWKATVRRSKKKQYWELLKYGFKNKTLTYMVVIIIFKGFVVAIYYKKIFKRTNFTESDHTKFEHSLYSSLCRTPHGVSFECQNLDNVEIKYKTGLACL